MSEEVTEQIIDGSRRRPNRLTIYALRIAVIVMFAAINAYASIRARSQSDSASKRLITRATELWQLAPFEAIGLLRATFDQLLAGRALESRKPVTVEPYGKFTWSDACDVYLFLFQREFELGRYDEAMSLAQAFPERLDRTILHQADCLVAMGRSEEAITLLERNLDLDIWDRRVHRRIEELSGSVDRASN